MGNNIILKAHTFINNITATATSDWAPVSYGYSGVQNRSIFGRRTDKDSRIHILGKVSVPQFNSDGSRNGYVEATATVTTFTSAADVNFSCMIETPLTHIKAVKYNASGAATVVGLI